MRRLGGCHARAALTSRSRSVGLGSSADSSWAEPKAAESATLIQVSHPRRLPSESIRKRIDRLVLGQPDWTACREDRRVRWAWELEQLLQLAADRRVRVQTRHISLEDVPDALRPPQPRRARYAPPHSRTLTYLSESRDRPHSRLPAQCCRFLCRGRRPGHHHPEERQVAPQASHPGDRGTFGSGQWAHRHPRSPCCRESHGDITICNPPPGPPAVDDPVLTSAHGRTFDPGPTDATSAESSGNGATRGLKELTSSKEGVAALTGAANGIGRAVVEVLVAEGMQAVLE